MEVNFEGKGTVVLMVHPVFKLCPWLQRRFSCGEHVANGYGIAGTKRGWSGLCWVLGWLVFCLFGVCFGFFFPLLTVVLKLDCVLKHEGSETCRSYGLH